METYDHKEVHETIRCQRNWDWNQPVNSEDIKLLREYLRKPPQQQGARCFNVIEIDNNYQAANRFQNICFNPSSNLTRINPQAHMMAPTVFIWTTSDEILDREDANKINLQIGIHSGIIIRRAAEMGYHTGFLGCGPNTPPAWWGWLTAYGKDTVEHAQFRFAVAVGTPMPDQEYNQNFFNPQEDHYHHPYDWPRYDCIDSKI